PAGLDDVDVDAMLDQLGSNGEGHAIEAPFAGVIRDAPGKWDAGVNAGNKDDLAAATPLDHVPGDELAHVEATVKRSLDDLVESFRIVVQEGRSPGVGRVADKNVDAAEGFQSGSNHVFARGSVEDVALD